MVTFPEGVGVGSSEGLISSTEQYAGADEKAHGALWQVRRVEVDSKFVRIISSPSEAPRMTTLLLAATGAGVHAEPIAGVVLSAIRSYTPAPRR